jgi:hypothetical protein
MSEAPGFGRQRADDLLRQSGFPVHHVAPGVWKTGLRGANATFQLWVSDEGSFIRFAIAPFLKKPVRPENRPALHRQLLELNPSIRMTRFALSPDGDVELIVDFPAAHLDESEFRDCLDALLYYADRNYPVLAPLCRE